MKSVLGRAGLQRSVFIPLLMLAAPAAAQTGAMVQATPPAVAVDRLNQNLNRLSRQPTDMDALIGAGQASYELGDAQAANGFFTRANMVNPRVGKVKIGLALVSLALKQPRDAAAYFDDAAELGEPAAQHMADRALAYDLTGQQEKAQRDYMAALRSSPDNADLIRGYAVSLGVSGRVNEAEAVLRPLLYKSDRAAWRDRTMILAMNGRTAEARKIAQSTMPRPLAEGMEPYLVRMGALTPAQKALAAHYGQFPTEGLRLAPVTSPQPPVQVAAKTEVADTRRRSRDRGRAEAARVATPAAPPEDSRLIAAMPGPDAPQQMAMVQAVPSSPAPVAARTPVQAPAQRAVRGAPVNVDDDPDGWTAAERSIAERRAAQTAQPAARAIAPVQGPVQGGTQGPARETAQPGLSSSSALGPGFAPTVRPSASPAPAPVREPIVGGRATASPTAIAPSQQVAQQAAQQVAQAPVAAAPFAAAPASPAPSAASAPPSPGFSSAPVSGTPTAPPLRSLAAIMADIQVPDSERTADTRAVDLEEVARIQTAKRKAAVDKAKKEATAKAKAEADAKAKEEAEEKARLKANPSRIWVQIATGKDPAALAFDMRRLRKTYSVLAAEGAFTAEWGQTRRLLVGPYTTQAKAKGVLTDLKKAGSDGFVWESEAGEVVTALSRK